MMVVDLRRGIVVLVAVLSFAAREVGGHGIKLDFRPLSSTQAHKVLLEKENNSESVRASPAGTERTDPLSYLKKYRGGYNITNKHYWSSAIFTGKYGYSIAAIWLTGGLVYAGALLTTAICFNNKATRENKRPDLSFKRYCLCPILLAILFTILATVASGVVLGGSSRFHTRARSIEGTILATAQEAARTIYNVTGDVSAMQADAELYGCLNGSTHLNSTLQKLNKEAASILSKAEKITGLVHKDLKVVKVATFVTVVLNVVVILFLLASAPLMPRRAFHLLIVISWLLTTFFWISFGLYFFLDKFTGDTCTALEEYRQEPQNSSLSSVLPCHDQPSASLVLRGAGAAIHDIIDEVNGNISKLQSSALPGLEYICNPISGPPEFNYQPENCSSDTIQIGDIPQILKRYTCSGGDGTCKQGEFISARDYGRVLIYTSSIQNIVDAYPVMESLVSCQLVKNASAEILFKQCKPLKKYARMTWAALVALSTVMVALVLIWAREAHRNGRCHSDDGSAKPGSMPTDTLDGHATELYSKRLEDKLEA